MKTEGGGGGGEDEKRTGEVEEEQRSFLDRGGDADVGDGDCKSSKKDLLPHTIADIVQSPSNFPTLQSSNRISLMEDL